MLIPTQDALQYINIPTGHLMPSCFGLINLLDLENPKQASINAIYYVNSTLIIRHNSHTSVKSAAKLQKNIQLTKHFANFNLIKIIFCYLFYYNVATIYIFLL
mgnify:CR=1 FL=1